MALVKCKECGAQVSTKARTCPSCGSPTRKPLTMLAFLGYTILGFALLGVVASFVEKHEASLTPAQRQARDQERAKQRTEAEKREAEAKAAANEKACSNDVPAYVMAQSFVEARLKAPSTAKFPAITANGVQTEYLGNCTHKIVGYVDAQNGFGAMLRTRYSVKLKNDPAKDTWSALEVKVDQ